MNAGMRKNELLRSGDFHLVGGLLTFMNAQ